MLACVTIPKMFVLKFDPNAIIPFALMAVPKLAFEDEAAAAAAASNRGFDVIVISRPGLLLLDDGFIAPIPLADEPLKAFDVEDETGCGRRGNRSIC